MRLLRIFPSEGWLRLEAVIPLGWWDSNFPEGTWGFKIPTAAGEMSMTTWDVCLLISGLQLIPHGFLNGVRAPKISEGTWPLDFPPKGRHGHTRKGRGGAPRAKGRGM